MKKAYKAPDCQLLVLTTEDVMTLSVNETAAWEVNHSASEWFQ